MTKKYDFIIAGGGTSGIITAAKLIDHGASVLILEEGIRTNNLLLTSLGFKPNYNTMDYFPIFRWFWLSAIGLFIGNNVYKDGKRTYSNPGFDKNGFSNLFVVLGKYSLEIYL